MFKVTVGEESPNCTCTAFTDAPCAINADAQVWRRWWGVRRCRNLPFQLLQGWSHTPWWKLDSRSGLPRGLEKTDS